MWKCPYCNEIVDRLDYSVTTIGNESGSASLCENPYLSITNPQGSTPIATINNFDHEDSGSTDWDGEPQYNCPHCSTDIKPSELIYIPKKGKGKKEEEKEPEETLHKIITPTNNIIQNTESNTLQCCLICKHCSHIFAYNINKNYLYEKSDEIYNCPNCSTPNSKENFNKLLKKGYFNKPNKHVKQKIKHRLIPTTKKPRK